MREGHSVFDVEHTYKVTTWLARLSWLHAAATADDAIEIRGNGISSSRICGRQEGGRWADGGEALLQSQSRRGAAWIVPWKIIYEDIIGIGYCSIIRACT